MPKGTFRRDDRIHRSQWRERAAWAARSDPRQRVGRQRCLIDQFLGQVHLGWVSCRLLDTNLARLRSSTAAPLKVLGFHTVTAHAQEEPESCEHFLLPGGTTFSLTARLSSLCTDFGSGHMNCSGTDEVLGKKRALKRSISPTDQWSDWCPASTGFQCSHFPQ
jgi:hypothetical protein